MLYRNFLFLCFLPFIAFGAPTAVVFAPSSMAPIIKSLKDVALYPESPCSYIEQNLPAKDVFLLQSQIESECLPEEKATTIKSHALALHAAYPAARIIVISPIPFSKPKGIFEKARALHQFLEKDIPFEPGLSYVNLFTKMPNRNKTREETYYDENGRALGERGAEIWCALISPILYDDAVTVYANEVEHGLVYADPAHFQGWPANGGLWVWGNEMLAIFTEAPFIEKSGHNIKIGGPEWYRGMRSLDGGKTWHTEFHPELERCSTLERAKAVPKERDIEPNIHGDRVDFSDPNLAVMMHYDAVFYSMDRGHSWSSPVLFGDFGRPMTQWGRTSYLPISKDACLFFMTEYAYDKPHRNVERGMSYTIETRDGGATYRATGEIGDVLEERLGKSSFERSQPSFGIMPSAARLPDGSLLIARRERLGERRWTGIYTSEDEGLTWHFLSIAEEGGDTPPALVYDAANHRAILIYCNRFPPYGLRGRVSLDGGKTWGHPYALRTDGREWDLGYNRAHLMEDGTIYTIYYYTTPERPQQHIAWTRWDVSSTLKRIEKSVQ